LPELQRHNFMVVIHSLWAMGEPLQSVNQTCAKVLHVPGLDEPSLKPLFSRDAGNGQAQGRRGVLILDQFEEVFKYHSDRTYFNQFIELLCALINDDSINLRIVFSMREEFLGELSIFDNRIPDLFNNYYRLKYPHKHEAKEIIRRTSALAQYAGADGQPAAVKVDEEKLLDLVEDLSVFEADSAATTSRAGNGARSHAAVRRDYIMPPYLQIACQRLWRRQFDVLAPPDATPAADAKHDFLARYQPGQARAELNSFCRETLNALPDPQKELAAEAFDFLVTKKGAKMAYEVSDLADKMEVDETRLRRVLMGLSEPDKRILRKSGPEDAQWYELYHDMYSPFVDEWKREYQKMKKAQLPRWLKEAAATAAGALIVITLLAAIWYLVVQPPRYMATLRSADLSNLKSYSAAQAAYLGLQRTLLYSGRGQQLWAEAWQRRARKAAQSELRDEALLAWLEAAAASPATANTPLARASELLGEDYPNLHATFRQEQMTSKPLFSANGRLVLTQNQDWQITLWQPETGEQLTPPVDLALLKEDEAARAAHKANRERGRQTISGLPNQSRAGLTEGPWAASANTGAEDQTITRFYLDIQTLADNAALGKLVGGVVTVRRRSNYSTRIFERWDRFYLWRATTGQLVIPPITLTKRGMEIGPVLTRVGEPFFNLSPDGQYIALNLAGSQVTIHKVSASVEEFNNTQRPLGNISALAFSLENDIVVTSDQSGAGSKNTLVKRWGLPELFSTPPGQYTPAQRSTVGAINTIMLSPNGRSFVTVKDNNPASLWDTASLQEDELKKLAIDSDITVRGVTDKGELLLEHSEWQGDGSSQLRLVDRDNTVLAGPFNASSGLNDVSISPDGRYFLATTTKDGTARLWRLPMLRPQGRLLTEPPGRFVDVAASTDGRIIATSHSNKAVTLWANTGSEVTRTTNALAAGPAATPEAYWVQEDWPQDYMARTEAPSLVLSADGRWLALRVRPELVVIRDRTSTQDYQLRHPAGSTVALIVIAPDGKTALTTDNKGILRTWPLMPEQLAPGGTPAPTKLFGRRLKFTSDGSYLIATTANYLSELMAWRWPSFDEVALPAQPRVMIRTLRLFGKRLIVGYANGSVRIWDLAENKPPLLLQTQSGVEAVALSPNGSRALIGNEDGTVSLWNLIGPGQPKKLGREDYRGGSGEIKAIECEADGQTALIITNAWVHGLGYDQDGLHPLDSRYIGISWLAPFARDGHSFQFLLGLDEQTIKIGSLNLDQEPPRSPLLTQAPQQLLDEWERRLGYSFVLGQPIGKYADIPARSAPER
ncbi:MAG TPA: WD40 repeat domain-containing protein, partial [Pyrinomonadaceae bacterium]